MTSATISTRNIAMNIYETLITRDDNNNPILELAESMVESPDHLTFTFKLRQGIKFHNGKAMTSADVAASFERYKKVGNQRSTLDNVAGWDTPDPATFVLRMSVAQPTFIEALSSFSVPIVIIPAELKDTPAQQLTQPVGTGPFQLVESVPGSYVKLKRFDGYQPNTKYEQRTGFGGYKQACLDTVTFRIVTEPGARVAGLKTGELHGVEDLPTKSLPDLKKDSKISILPLNNWWIQIANPNTSAAPTDNLLVRKAIQAPLRQIAQNAGEDGAVIAGKTLEKDEYTFGYDAQSGEFKDMVKSGIIDPTKVVRTALQDAASVAGLLVTTEAMVAEKPGVFLASATWG